MNKNINSEICRSQGGFTLIELLVALTMTSLIAAMTLGHVFMIRDHYFKDVIRTRINSNLRSAMDIVAMNIRQSGENLQTSFPVILLTNSTSTSSDVLTLRRGLYQEVLTLCVNAASGATTLNVSSTAVTNPDCQAANVAALYNVFNTYRTQNSGNVRAFIYDSITGASQFVNYTGGSTAGGQYSLTVNGLSAAYPRLTTHIYLIEQYEFSRDLVNNTLDLVVDGQTAQRQPVAFSVTAFDVVLQMEDGSDLTSWAFGNPSTWRDISRVQIYLTGQENFKGHTISSGIQSAYFPRNVLSY